MYFSRLAEVGILETPKLQGKYDTGQVKVIIDLFSKCTPLTITTRVNVHVMWIVSCFILAISSSGFRLPRGRSIPVDRQGLWQRYCYKKWRKVSKIFICIICKIMGCRSLKRFRFLFPKKMQWCDVTKPNCSQCWLCLQAWQWFGYNWGFVTSWHCLHHISKLFKEGIFSLVICFPDQKIQLEYRAVGRSKVALILITRFS